MECRVLIVFYQRFRREQSRVSSAAADPSAFCGQVQQAVQSLIDQHQQIPGNIMRALLERFHSRKKNQ